MRRPPALALVWIAASLVAAQARAQEAEPETPAATAKVQEETKAEPKGKETGPTPLHMPSAEEMSALYPDRAQRENVSGKAMVECKIAASTRLVGCIVTSETPPGYGFGEAALKAAAVMRVRPGTWNGEPIVDGKVRFPVGFRMADPAPAVPPPAQADQAAPTAPETAPSKPEPPSPPRPPPPAMTPANLWVAIGFALVLLAGMPLALFWPDRLPPWRPRR